jgi:hypothetical protein
MEITDINAGTPDAPGGRILRDATGAPTGVLVDEAQQLVSRKIPRPSRQQVEQSLLRATQELARDGITTVHDAGVQYADLDAYRSLIRKGQLPIHIYAMILYPLPLPDNPDIGDYLTVRGLKMVADGALGSRGAAMIEPYADDPGNRGLLILDRWRRGISPNSGSIRLSRPCRPRTPPATCSGHRTGSGRRGYRVPMRGRRFCAWACMWRMAGIPVSGCRGKRGAAELDH